MFEIALCVLAYIVVLWIEFSPAVLERFGLGKRALKACSSAACSSSSALGVLLPTMHQSSLGTMLVAMSTKLSPLWLDAVCCRSCSVISAIAAWATRW